MSMHGENQVRNFFVVGSSTNTTMSAVKAGIKLNSAIIQSDGTAAADNEDFALVIKNNRDEITLSDIVNPSKVKSAKSIAYAARTVGQVVISGITAEANKLYQVTNIISGYGSLSVENEYVKEAFYKSKTGDTAEDIVDGLVKSLARNYYRDQPAAGTTFAYTLKGGTVVQLPDNLVFSFAKGYTTQTIDVDTAPTADASATVTINGTAITVALLDADTDSGAATKIAAAINGVDGQSAAAVGTVITVTSDEASSIVYDAGTTGTTVTQAGTGTTSGLIISEKADWLSKYYVTGKKTRLSLSYKIDVYFPTQPTITTVKGYEGAGTGYHVRNLEEYFLGNRGDSFRGAGYPHNFEQTYDSVLTGTYSLIELEYFDEGRDDPMKSKKQITIAAPSTAVANVLIGQLNTALTTKGIAIATL